ncbi:MAG: hypothetical protein ACREHD_25045, partial [Pirellulales bacterium]
LTEEVKARAAQYDSAQETLQRFEAERAEAQSTFDQERTAWQTESDLRTTELNQKSLKFAAVSERLSQVEAELAHANEQIVRLTEEVKARAAQYDSAQETLQRFEAERAEAQSTFDQERTAWQTESDLRIAELNEKRRELAVASESFQRLAEKLEETQAAFDNARTSWRTEREARSAELSEKSLELAAAEERLNRLDAKRADHDLQAAALREKSQQFATATEQLSRLHAELSRLQEEHAEAQAAFEQARTEWQAEQSQSSMELAAAVERATNLEAELEAAKREIAGRSDETDNQADEERQAALERLAAELSAVRQTVDKERQLWFAERNELRAGVAEAESRNAALEGRLTELTDELVSYETPNGTEPVGSGPALNECVEKQPTRTEDLFASFTTPETAEIAFQTPPSDAPVSSVDLLSRFGLSVHQETPEPAPPSPQRTEATTPQPVAEAGPAKPAHADGHHDEQDSIDAYMAQLMARLGKPGYAPPQEVAPQPPQVSETVPEPQAAAPATAPRQPSKLWDPSEMGRRAAPPELATDLSAMRELANLNARAAIDTHARSALVKAWLSKALLMLLGMVTAGVETWFAMEGNEWAGYFIVPCLMIGIFWGWQYLVMSKRLHSSRDAAAEPSGEASPAPEGTEEVDA